MKIRAAVSPVVNQMKTRVGYFAVAFAVVLGMTNVRTASAQYGAQVKIPFAFSANRQAFPAGTYRVFRESDQFLRVVSTETGIETGLLVHTSRGFAPVGKNSLVFRHDERGYYLVHVKFAEGPVQSDMTLLPRNEREIAKAATDSQTEVGMN